MALPRSVIERLIFGTQQMRRFTQDSPVMPDVWLAYNESPGEAVDLLLTPYKDSQPAALYVALRARLRADSRRKRAGDTTPRGLTYNESYVVARMTLPELIRCALPLTKWWTSYVWPEARKASGKASPGEAPADALKARIESLRDPDVRRHLVQLIERRRSAVAGPVKEERPAPAFSPSSDLLWMLEIAGSIAAHGESQDAGMPPLEEAVRKVQEMIAGIDLDDLPKQPLLWAVNRNRPVTQAVWKSSLAVKADAARRLFDISCRGLRWAVIDSGVDATHPAFRRRVGDNPHAEQHKEWLGAKGENRTRIAECYDFTKLRGLLDPEMPEDEAGKVTHFTADDRRRMKDLRASIEQGGMLDWERLAKLVRVPLDKRYPKPVNVHGTHVAGILAGDWRITDGIPEDYDLQGMCPDLELIDVRVLDAGGQSDEFTVLAALQFIRYLNANKARPAVHGVNLSLSLYHSVMNYACGQTPVCEECQRLVNTGTVVVAAAGNEGHAAFLTSQGSSEGYRNISITDPGNAEAVITVGATHRNRAFTYGVSYFSSRGPTGDGRSKPDLVAPGEKISSSIPGDDLDSLDGTSMAAPHVSGAAALLMARHDELIGDPLRIKKILCQTATDLGRERFFQGAGMLDVLRALQSV